MPKSHNADLPGLSGVSLFSGAGGMDVGFAAAGVDILWANDIDRDAVRTYAANHACEIQLGDIDAYIPGLKRFDGVDLLLGGPPCQGFSVAGKMDPFDPRSELVFAFMRAVGATRPRAFICENVKALGLLEKFRGVRERMIVEAAKLGYECALVILRASDYGVPQGRERMFLVGFTDSALPEVFRRNILAARRPARNLRDTIAHLGRAGTATNARICRAKVTMAASPVLRKSPYAGMLFNGQGRPLNPDGYASTLAATMGGNRTPIIDEDHLYDGKPGWVEEYHASLMAGAAPAQFDTAPERLRRLTVDEAILLQTFPADYDFVGPQSAIFKQIGNAVPCKLAEAVALAVKATLARQISNSSFETDQLKLAI